MTPFIAWILFISTQVRDGGGVRPMRGIPNDGATAIAAVCTPTPSPRMCASVYVVMAFRESGYKLDAIGDGGKAKGPFQVHQLRLPKDWDEAVKQYTALLVRSVNACPENPLAMLASGSCTNRAGIAISRARLAEAKRLAGMEIKQ